MIERTACPVGMRLVGLGSLDDNDAEHRGMHGTAICELAGFAEGERVLLPRVVLPTAYS